MEKDCRAGDRCEWTAGFSGTGKTCKPSLIYEVRVDLPSDGGDFCKPQETTITKKTTEILKVNQKKTEI